MNTCAIYDCRLLGRFHSGSQCPAGPEQRNAQEVKRQGFAVKASIGPEGWSVQNDGL